MTQQDSGTTGIGDDDIDQDGRPDPTTSQAETGGSGGAGLTRHEGDGAPGDTPAPTSPAPDESGALGTGRDDRHGVQRGFQDTRTAQADAHAPTGLGSAETGANQAPGDLAPGPGKPGA